MQGAKLARITLPFMVAEDDPCAQEFLQLRRTVNWYVSVQTRTDVKTNDSDSKERGKCEAW